ncbi:MAG: heme ABC exporter ATP-binding protein CcmA [Gemmatimonadetes bacterium]|nr:heme ABC exporter ATP-binding protein CcmA [Gemmatimonadota bacterium]MYG86641.1 heme ABC exporter ATP-binding protein CcmA [Gemmatimonadota bacterium]MYJ89208.1 heme ABC exporter ATP-binding protein CcmA [Gemmatimonadota bacterium]
MGDRSASDLAGTSSVTGAPGTTGVAGSPGIPGATGAPGISVRQLTKSYGRFRALHRVDLDVAPGSFLALFGPNGAGKSTLLGIIAGLVRPSRGQVFLDGEEITKDRDEDLGKRIGALSYQTYLYDELTVLENLRFYGRLFGVENREERIGSLLQTVGMEARSGSPVRTLSRGMRQRVALARALLHDPDILLLDEPYSGLDQDAMVMLKTVLTARNKTILLVTHDLVRGLESADRVAILNHGRLVFEAETSELSASDFEQTYRDHAV